MTVLDWIVIVIYMLGMIGLSVYLGRNQQDQADYYVGGRNLPWWAVGISTMATQSSAISFISIPAFVALKKGGGMTWLQYEAAVPLAMIAVMVVLIPFFRKLELISVYEYLEYRYDRRVRLFMSGVFLLSRGFATGIGVYATALVLMVCLGTPLWLTIILIGVVTLIYDTIGGMAAVVYSDVVQLFILLFGLGICIYVCADMVGGIAPMFEALPRERYAAMDLSWGLDGSSASPFWGFLIGGFFLYASYYGVDQSQAQRELSAPTLADTKRSLIFNGLARFPLTLLYVFVGVAAGAAYLHSPELQAAVPADKLDHLMPQLILQNFPSGLRALVFAAILAAAMSSLDSALNSISAATMRDFIEPNRPDLSNEQAVFTSKVVTVIWGIVITACAFGAGHISDTVIEGINKVGSAFYGPILAAFAVGILSVRITANGVLVGVVAGVLFNVVLWVFLPDVYWMWWNLTGLVVTVVVAYAASMVGKPPAPETLARFTLSRESLAAEKAWLPTYAILVGYFLVIIGVLVGLQSYAHG